LALGADLLLAARLPELFGARRASAGVAKAVMTRIAESAVNLLSLNTGPPSGAGPAALRQERSFGFAARAGQAFVLRIIGKDPHGIPTQSAGLGACACSYRWFRVIGGVHRPESVNCPWVQFATKPGRKLNMSIPP
jgi:hypothetical protein